MIALAIVIPYVALGLAVGRWTALRRMKQDRWATDIFGDETKGPRDDDYLAVALAFLFWWMAAPLYLMARPPRSPKAEKLEARIKELEKELEL